MCAPSSFNDLFRMKMQDEDLANTMRALGHPVRLNILRILAKTQSQCCCADLNEHLPLAQSTVSQHIKVLLDAGLIERQARGTKNCYTLRTDRIDALNVACGGLFSGLMVTANQELESA